VTKLHALDILGDPTRRRILELLQGGEQCAGDLAAALHRELGISQPAVSQHLRVLRDHGFVRVRPDAQRRVYEIDPAPLQEVDAWIDRFRSFWAVHLDALATEIARGKRERAKVAPAAVRPRKARAARR
jgi:DNA-binding transcriptional ArsR family regulator